MLGTVGLKSATTIIIMMAHAWATHAWQLCGPSQPVYVTQSYRGPQSGIDGSQHCIHHNYKWEESDIWYSPEPVNTNSLSRVQQSRSWEAPHMILQNEPQYATIKRSRGGSLASFPLQNEPQYATIKRSKSGSVMSLPSVTTTLRSFDNTNPYLNGNTQN